MMNRKTILIVALCLQTILGAKVITGPFNPNGYISGELYGDNSIFCRTYCARGEVCTRLETDPQHPICNPYCGDGLIVTGKQGCDDKNNIAGDGCSNCIVDKLYICSSGEPSVCSKVCGNNILDTSAGEICDNGNSEIIDGCSNECEPIQHWNCVNKVGEISVCTYVPYCGDGFTTGSISETCDDANAVDGDGCSASCQIQPFYLCTTDTGTVPAVSVPSVCTWSCGDNIFQPSTGEKCDNGNSTDGCDDSCQLVDHWTCESTENQASVCTYVPYCGDGFTTGSISETCDDANAVDGDGCSASCQIQPFYLCTTDTGTVPAVSVPSVCTWSCGDNIFQPSTGEKCDNGNSIVVDGCSDSCEIINNWECTTDPQTQASICKLKLYCGDGVITPSLNQVCDDGNKLNGDGCSSTCTVQAHYVCATLTTGTSNCTWSCGNKVYEPLLGEQCDNGNNTNPIKSDGCTDDCKIQPNWRCTHQNSVQLQQSQCKYIPDCGDNIHESSKNEECDDGNLINGDGCSKTCLVQSGWKCKDDKNNKSICNKI